MTGLREDILTGAVAGATGTLAMDVAGGVGRRLGAVPEGDIGTAQLGRWIGYMGKGKFMHDRLSQEPALPMEKQLGRGAHYLIGMMLGVGYMGCSAPSAPDHGRWPTGRR